MIYGTQEYNNLLVSIIKDGARHSTYAETVKHAEEMGIHINGDQPKALLDRIRPREDAEVKQYRLENYEPTTKAGADKSMDIVAKIFNPTLYSIRWKTESSDVEELKKYTLDYYPEYNSIMNYNKEVVLRQMIADPNGIIAIKPDRIPTSDAERIDKPVAVTYGSSAIWYRDKDHYLIHIREEKAQKNGDSNKFYFEYFDKTVYLTFWAYYDIPNKQLVQQVETQYVHDFGEIPAWDLRGKTKSYPNGERIYESYFSSALPHWNLAIIHESDLLGAYINHLHPQKYEMAEECSYQFPWNGQLYPCHGGSIKYPGMDGNTTTMKCPACSGSGLTTVKSPYGAYQFTKQKLEETGGTGGLTPVGYITIPTEATKMLQDRCEDMIRKGMWAINMDVEDKVGEVQSGVAKEIDRSAQSDTLYTIASNVFDVHVNNEYYFINKYMFSVSSRSANRDEDPNLPQVNKPTSFNIMTSSELIYNYKVAKDSGLDRNVMRSREIDILSKDFSTNPDLKQYLVTMLNLDPLPGLLVDDVNAALGRGLITKEDGIIHMNLKTFMDRAIQESQDFINMPKDKQLEVFEKYADEIVQANKITIDVSAGFSDPGGNHGDNGE